MKTLIKNNLFNYRTILRLYLVLLILPLCNSLYGQSNFKDFTSSKISAEYHKSGNKLLKSFNKSFKTAANTRWFMVGKKYLATFDMDGMKHRVLYTKNGTPIYSICYGREKDLPYSLLEKIKIGYPQNHIAGAINVKQEGRNIWIVQLENADQYIKVRMEDNNLEEIENFRKSF